MTFLRNLLRWNPCNHEGVSIKTPTNGSVNEQLLLKVWDKQPPKLFFRYSPSAVPVPVKSPIIVKVGWYNDVNYYAFVDGVEIVDVGQEFLKKSYTLHTKLEAHRQEYKKIRESSEALQKFLSQNCED